MPASKMKLSVALGILALSVLLLSAHSRTTRADNLANRIFEGQFEVTIHEGPSAVAGPVRLSGVLKLKIDPSGGFTGTLTPSEGQTSVVIGNNLIVSDPAKVEVAGQITGRAFNLVLDLGNGKRIYGAGTAKNDLSQRRAAADGIGGTASGPESGDRADWIGDGSVHF